MPLTALSSAASLALASFAGDVVQVHFLIRHLNHLTAVLLGTARLGPAARIARPLTGVQNGRASLGGKTTISATLPASFRAPGDRLRPPGSAAPPCAPGQPSHAARRAVSGTRGDRRQPGAPADPPAVPPPLASGQRARRAPPCHAAAGRRRRAARRRRRRLHGGENRLDLGDLSRRPVAEEGQGQVQRLRSDPAQSRVGQLGLAPGRDVPRGPSRADRARRTCGLACLGLRTCSPDPRYGVQTHGLSLIRNNFELSPSRLREIGLERRLAAAEQDPQQVHPDQGRAFADVLAATGDDRVAGDAVPSARRAWKQT